LRPNKVFGASCMIGGISMQEAKERVALGSVVASAGLTLAKTVVGFASGSLAILSEAGHSLADLVATVITYFAVRVSGKPADAEHHYGHGKIESISALAATALLFVLAGIVFWESGQRLFGDHGHTVEATFWAFGVIVLSIVVDFFRARQLRQVAKESSSQALEADALHFDSDLWSSLAVLVGLAAVAAGYLWADAVAAGVVGVLICVAGWRLARRTIDTLTDTAPEGAAEKIAAIARRVGGVVAIERVRARQVGPQLFVELGVAVSRLLPLDRVSAVQSECIAAIRAALPEAEVTVTITPKALNNETVLERVIVIARNRGLAVHHIMVHQLAGGPAISLDLEVDRAMPLGKAHEIASGLEDAIGEDIGGRAEVETHIEPMQTAGISGREAVEKVRAEIADLMGELVPANSPLGDVHEVRVRETPLGLVVNFHCRADPALPVEAVHAAVDELERRLKERRRDVHRVIGHAEPA
jgi:cation diffusion facilitator family transporter